jgi:hypothetical protein
MPRVAKTKIPQMAQDWKFEELLTNYAHTANGPSGSIGDRSRLLSIEK